MFDLQAILHSLENCPCGREHKVALKHVEIAHGVARECGRILAALDFPRTLLLVTDKNALGAAPEVPSSLEAAGFCLKQLIYDNMTYAKIEQVREVEALLSDVGGVLALGTGSINDICRVASYNKGKQFAIFATAPSMDGFASDSAPIIENNFKNSWYVEQPSVILADTAVLAKAPAELKAAGFGDMMAKYIGILDWRISELLTGEYYCPAIADLTMKGVAKIVAQADRVQSDDEAAVADIMEGLIMSGVAMKLANSSRPASGAEHVVSHYWECYKLARGIWPEFHGKKVGVATVLINRIYHNIADRVTEIDPIPDPTDWEEVRAAFDASQHADLMKVNTPTITDKVDVQRLREKWPEIRRMIAELLPDDRTMMRLMQAAGAVTDPADVHVDDALLEKGLKYHAYMRYRVLLTRLLPMMQLNIMDFID
ncbi:MAG: iron-containing alcohol dehydrogenase [Clostridia bacterium]|nr:iron-containing alcohol dehydrogenase [Clostridia bacterium]